LKTLMKDEGIVILQASNAVAFHRRLQILAGHNPYNLISDNPLKPAHFREYTADEISDYCSKAGFKILDMTFENYYDYRYIHHEDGHLEKKEWYRVVNLCYSLFPRSLRPGMCFILSSDSKEC